LLRGHGGSFLTLPESSGLLLASLTLVIPRGVGVGGGKDERLILALLWGLLESSLGWEAGETGGAWIKLIPFKRAHLDVRKKPNDDNPVSKPQAICFWSAIGLKLWGHDLLDSEGKGLGVGFALGQPWVQISALRFADV
jgi:hypothetical protein